MSKIKTPNGVIEFKSKPLFLGVKQINKEIAKENLLLLKKILDNNNIPFMLTYGTLLGAVREHDFIEHDEDIDLSLKEEYRDAFLRSLPALFKEGFELVRFDRRDLYSIMRKGEYIDFYFFRQIEDDVYYCSGERTLAKFFNEPETLELFGTIFNTHSNPEDFLLFEYGYNWKTPIKYNNYNVSKINLLMQKGRQWLKDVLPDWIYLRLAKRSEKKLHENFNRKLKRYNNLTTNN